MYCSKCGSEIPEDAVFCAICGEKIVNKVGVTNGKKGKKKNFLVKMIGSIILLIIISGVVFIYYNGKSPVIDEEDNLLKYGTEYAGYQYPSSKIAEELLSLIEGDVQLYNVDLRPGSTDTNTDVLTEFDEEIELSYICCQPYADFMVDEDGYYSSGSLWIRTGWGEETNELRNIFIEFNDDYIDWDALMYNVFHNIDIEGMGELYDRLYQAETIEINDGWHDCEVKIVDNVVAISFKENFYNIEFLPHTVYVEDGELFYSTGEKVKIDTSWVYNVFG